MLRPFQIVSDPIEFDLDGLAIFQFPRTTKGSSRCAIYAISHNLTGADILSESGFGVILTGLSVAGRNYFTGRVPLPLMSDAAAGAVPPATHANFANRFYGSAIPHPNTYLGGNSMCSAMAISGSEEIVMRLEELDSQSTVNQVTLWCVQWPDDLNDPEQVSWEAMYSHGIGEAFFVGNENVGFPATGDGFVFNPLPQPPSARALRRLGFRGVMTTGDGSILFQEQAPAGTPGFNNLLMEVDGDFSRPPQNRFANARSMAGLLGFPVTNGIYDMQRNERSTVRILSGGVAIAPDPDRRIYILHMFEGRNFNTPPNALLGAATAIS